MSKKHLLALFAGILLVGRAVAAEKAAVDEDWWWDHAWWDDQQIDVPDNYEINSSWTSYQSGDVEVTALVARPADSGRYPAVLFVHGRRGLDALVQRLAKRVAARGFVAHISSGLTR